MVDGGLRGWRSWSWGHAKQQQHQPRQPSPSNPEPRLPPSQKAGAHRRGGPPEAAPRLSADCRPPTGRSQAAPSATRPAMTTIPIPRCGALPGFPPCNSTPRAPATPTTARCAPSTSSAGAIRPISPGSGSAITSCPPSIPPSGTRTGACGRASPPLRLWQKHHQISRQICLPHCHRRLTHRCHHRHPCHLPLQGPRQR